MKYLITVILLIPSVSFANWISCVKNVPNLCPGMGNFCEKDYGKPTDKQKTVLNCRFNEINKCHNSFSDKPKDMEVYISTILEAICNPK